MLGKYCGQLHFLTQRIIANRNIFAWITVSYIMTENTNFAFHWKLCGPKCCFPHKIRNVIALWCYQCHFEQSQLICKDAIYRPWKYWWELKLSLGSVIIIDADKYHQKALLMLHRSVEGMARPNLLINKEIISILCIVTVFLGHTYPTRPTYFTIKIRWQKW